MEKILKSNKMDNLGKYEILRFDIKTNGVYVESSPKVKLLLALSQKTKLKTPSCKIYLEKRIRWQLTEEQYMEAYNKRMKL